MPGSAAFPTRSENMAHQPYYPLSQQWRHYLRRFRVQYFRPTKFQWLQEQRRLQSSDDYSCRPFDQHRCIFVHIPKCAGISICRSLFGNLAGAHQSIKRYEIMFAPHEFTDYFKFTFVRNPWDRLVSAFLFMKQGGITANDKIWSEKNLSEYPDFETFVRHGITRKNIRSFPHFRPQCEFICLKKDEPAVDFIGYFENLKADFARVCERLKLNAVLQELNRNATRKRDYRDYYTDETRQRVADAYASDIRVLGYSFDNSTLSATLARRGI